jgi:hypothetical protein
MKISRHRIGCQKCSNLSELLIAEPEAECRRKSIYLLWAAAADNCSGNRRMM